MRRDANLTSDEGFRTLRSGASHATRHDRCTKSVSSKGGVDTTGDVPLPLEEGPRILRSGSSYAPRHERSRTSSSSKRSVETSGDSHNAVPAWAFAASVARADNQQALREQMDAVLPFHTGGIYPPARLCPRAIQAKAKKDAQVALAELLRTPVCCSAANSPATIVPGLLDCLPEPPVSRQNAAVWDSPIGAYYRTQAAKQTHVDGNANAPVQLFDDSDVEDEPLPSAKVNLIPASNSAVVSPRVAGLPSCVLHSATLVPDNPRPIVVTNFSREIIPSIVPFPNELPLQFNSGAVRSSWSVHPMMAAAALRDNYQNGGQGPSADAHY